MPHSQLTAEDAQYLHEAQSSVTFISSPAGTEFSAFLSSLEDEALRAIKDCADYREATELVIRYQQRSHVVSRIRAYFDSQRERIAAVNAISREEESSNVYDPYADPDFNA